MLPVIVILFFLSSVHCAGPLGINGWLEFVDYAKNGGWSAYGTGTYTEDSNGWPTCDINWEVMDLRRNMFWSGPDPYGTNLETAGTYKLSFVGQATIGGSTEDGNIIVQNQQYDSTSGITTADLIVPANRWLFFLSLSNTKRTASSATGTGFTNLRLVKEKYGNSTQLFTNECLNSYGPGFSFNRLLGIDDTNNYQTLWNDTTILFTYWEDRPKPTDAHQYGTLVETTWPHQGRGVCWEYIVAFANQLNLDIWINVPIAADDTYVQNLANLFRYGSDGLNPYTSSQANPAYPPLNSNLHIYLEYSNEVWNWGFQQSVWNEYWAGVDNITNDCEYVKRTYEIAVIFQNVYGSNFKSTIRPVVLWQYGNWDAIHRDLAWLQDTYKVTVSDYVYGVGQAPYYDTADHQNVDSILNTLRLGSESDRSDFLGWKAVSEFYQIKEVGYESGPSLGAGLDTIAMRDARLTDTILHHYVDNWFGVGGDVVGYFAGGFGAASSCGGTWNQGEDPDFQFSVKMDGIEKVLAAPQPTVQVGQALPWTTNANTSISTGAPDVWGITPPSWGGVYLFRSESAGTYQITVNGNAANANIQVQVWLDNAAVGNSIAMGGNVVTGTVNPGYHSITLKYVYINGQTSGTGSAKGIVVALVSGGGSAILGNPPTGLAFKASASGQLDIYWDVSNGATNYNVYRSATTPFDTFTKIGSTSTATYTDTGLNNGQIYYYSVTAVNAAGESAQSPKISAVPVSAVPTQPTGLQISGNAYAGAACGNGGGVVQLTWTATANTQKYNIKRANNGTCGSTVTTSMTPTFTEAGLDTSQSWTYCVSAVNALGEGPNSNGVTLKFASMVPDAPTNLKATPTNKGISLSWTVSPLMTPTTDPEYRVYRSTTSGGSYTLQFSVSVANVIDRTVDNDTPYYYVIRAHSPAGESSNSNEATATASSKGIIQINAGSSSASGAFVADTDNNNVGAAETTSASIDLSWIGSAVAAPSQVYQSAHAATSSSDLIYTIPGLNANAPYHLILHFAETKYTTLGQRFFSVLVNDQTILSNYDLLLRTNGVNNVAWREEFNVWSDSTGNLKISFHNGNGSTGNAFVSGIEVY